MSRWSCAALALVASCGTLPVRAPEVDSVARRDVHWQRSLADAEQLARETGRPILLALNMDGESASDRIWHENYRDPAFVALTRRCVCLGASVFRHNPVDHDELGRRVECPRFPGLTCGEHMALEPQLFERWFVDGERVAPRHALIRPDGTVAFDISLAFDLADVDRALDAATAGLAPWARPEDGGWAALAARRDARGRASLEQAVLGIGDPATRAEALEAIALHGDRGSLDALRLVAARLPDVPEGPLVAVARRLGLVDEFDAVLRQQGQRLGPVASDLTPPPELAAVLRAVARRDAPRGTKAWLVGLAATDVRGDVAVRAATAAAWPQDGITAARRDPVDVPALLDLGVACVAGETALPWPGPAPREPAPGEELRERLRQLDDRLARDRDDAATLAEIGVASLDLGRVEIQEGGAAALLLLEDAERYLGRALEREPQRFEWWIERARTAYYRERFDEQHRYGARALDVAGFGWPAGRDVWPQLVRDVRAVDAVRWIGDADARRLAVADLDDGAGTVDLARSALLALGLSAVSPFGRGRDFVGVASLAESLGLVREELALLAAGLERLPGDGELHQAIAAALWRAGRGDVAPALAERTLRPTPGAEAAWWAGYQRLLAAEDQRRRERPHSAAAHYAAAERLFAACAEANPDYAGSATSYVALTWLGRGHAAAQGAAADRRLAADCLVQAAATGADLTNLRDGLGYDAIDLVDKVLEWRSGGPGPVAPLALLDELLRAAPDRVAFWSALVSDSALREALRADGRNPERAMADTVDAKGDPIRMPMGLPTQLGDEYLAAAVAAGARAASADDASEDDRIAFAQALTIRAERELVRGRLEQVGPSLQAAAGVLGVELPAGADSDPAAALRTRAAFLRERLGPARPRQRDGR